MKTQKLYDSPFRLFTSRILFFILCLTALTSQAQKKDKSNVYPEAALTQAENSGKFTSSFVDLIHYEGFITQSPVIYAGDLPVWDKDGKDTAIKQNMLKLVAQQEKLKSLLPDFNIDFYIKKFTSSGVQYGISGVTGEPGNYEITYDITKSTTVPLTNGNSETAGAFVRVGVGVRIKASITTLQADIDVSNLWHLAQASQTGLLKGGLSFQIFGIDGPEVINISPNSNAIIDASSISSFMQSIAILKSRFYDKSIILVPRVFSVQRKTSDLPANLVGSLN